MNYVNFNEREESTIIEIALIMKRNWFKILFVVPILSILTIFVFPLILYHSSRLRAYWFYSQVSSIEEA
ncbi:MAG: hypothetical protein ACK521_01375 [bacterium]